MSNKILKERTLEMKFKKDQNMELQLRAKMIKVSLNLVAHLLNYSK